MMRSTNNKNPSAPSASLRPRAPSVGGGALRYNAAGLGLTLTTLALLSLGVVMVHSAVASVGNPGPWYARMDIRHTIFAGLAVLVLAAAWRLDYRIFAAGPWLPILATALLVVSLICGALVFVPGIGHVVGGYARWIRIGPARYSIGFQPSELIKLTLVIFLAAWLTRKTVDPARPLKSFLPALLVVGGCVALVITQDLGTGLVIGVSALVTMFLAGVPWYHLAPLVPAGGWSFWHFVMQDPIRRARIDAWLDPWSTINPCTYQPRQSLMSILSGGWFGRGLGQGMNKLGFLPEDSTDFIFATFCEEVGFAGAMLLMGLVLLWMWHARRAAVRAPDRFGQALAGSLGFLIAAQMVLHIAVDLVAIPPTGMSLPFVSAGGTALVMMATATALIISVAVRRPPETFGRLALAD